MTNRQDANYLTSINTNLKLKQVVATAWHALFLDANGVVYGSGTSENRQLGSLADNSYFYEIRKSPAFAGLNVQQISTSPNNSVLLLNNNTLMISGLGPGDNTTALRIFAVASSISN